MRASSVPRLDYLTRFNASRTVLEKTLGEAPIPCKKLSCGKVVWNCASRGWAPARSDPANRSELISWK